MNIGPYNLDTLRKIVRSLYSENRKLKQRLRDAGISYEEENAFQEAPEQREEYDPDQGARIIIIWRKLDGMKKMH